MKILKFEWAALDVRGGFKYAVGVTIVIALLFGESADTEMPTETAADEERPSVMYVGSYAATVALVMTLGLVLGDRWLKSDPTLILQASLMIIMPSALGTWTVAVDRIIGVIAELIGVAFAGIAVSMREVMARKFNKGFQ